MSPRDFVDTIAVPTVREFMKDPTQHRGYLACIVAYHVGDYLTSGQTKKLHKKMEADLGRPFLVLQRMCNAAKHSETSRGGVILMRSGSDKERQPVRHDGTAKYDGTHRHGMRGRYIEDEGEQYDMLDLCLIVLRKFAHLYPVELNGSAIEGIHHSTREYPKL